MADYYQFSGGSYPSYNYRETGGQYLPGRGNLYQNYHLLIIRQMVELQKRELQNRMFNQTGYLLSQTIPAAFVRAAAAGSRGTSDRVLTFAAILRRTTPKLRKDLEQANIRLAADMRQRLVFAYAQKVERRKQVASYRIGQNRYSGGALKRALQSSDMAVGLPDKILYLNRDRLDIEARQWARLNYGAAPAATPRPGRYPIRFNDVTIMTVGSRAAQRPGFSLPAGFWQSIGGPQPTGGAPGTREIRLGKWTKSRQGGMNFTQTGTRTISGRGFGRAGNARAWGKTYGSYSTTPRNQIRGARQGFFALDANPRYPTRGIVGVNYVDAGFIELQSKFSDVYYGLLYSWLNDSKNYSQQSVQAGREVIEAWRAADRERIRGKDLAILGSYDLVSTARALSALEKEAGAFGAGGKLNRP